MLGQLVGLNMSRRLVRSWLDVALRRGTVFRWLTLGWLDVAASRVSTMGGLYQVG